MPTPPTPPSYWWLTVRIDACRTRDERVAAVSGDDAVRMWRELHPNVEVIHVRPVPELVDIELEHMSINNNNNTDPIRGVPPLLAARDALAEPDGPAVPEGREPASVVREPSDEELMATLDKATAAFPPRHPEAEALNAVEYPLALELRKARAVLARWGHHSPDATKMVGPAEGEVGDPPPELVHRWEVDGQHHTYETPLSIHIATQAARWGAAQVVHRSAVPVADGPAVPEGREPASAGPTDEELRAVWCDGWNTSEEWGALNFARAVLARFGNHSPDATKMVGPAAGDVRGMKPPVGEVQP